MRDDLPVWLDCQRQWCRARITQRGEHPAIATEGGVETSIHVVARQGKPALGQRFALRTGLLPGQSDALGAGPAV